MDEKKNYHGDVQSVHCFELLAKKGIEEIFYDKEEYEMIGKRKIYLAVLKASILHLLMEL